MYISDASREFADSPDNKSGFMYFNFIIYVCIPVVFYIIPQKLKDDYTKMNDKFVGTLLAVVKAVLANRSVADVRCYLLAFKAAWSDAVKAVQDKEGLIILLRQYCNLSNFDLLQSLAHYFNLVQTTEKLADFTKERDDFYKRILAVDFAEIIEDHKTISSHREVRLALSHQLCICIFIVGI